MLNKVTKLLKKDDYFGIALYKNESYKINGFANCEPILLLKIGNLLKPKPLLIQADPFLFVKDDTLYLFYESMTSGSKGIIRMINTKDLINWSQPIDVLIEPFHLSFPFVFEDNGEIYMIPESNSADSIRIYKANSDLTRFQFIKTLLKKKRTPDVKFNYLDSHIIKKDNLYYLFTSVAYNWTYHLELFYSHSLLNEEFIPHPQSPICISNEYGRSAGSIIHLDEHYYRISQDCHIHYGENISIHKIKELSPDSYQEKLYLHNVIKHGGSIYRNGGHQLNITKFNNYYIYATDFRHYAWSWHQQYARIAKNIRALFNRQMSSYRRKTSNSKR